MTMTRSRDEILAAWYVDRPVTASAPTDTVGYNYVYTTAEAQTRLGEPPYWALISQADRDKLAGTGAAMPDGSYPITTCDGPNSVRTAIRAVGRGGGSHNAIRKHIITRARSLGCSSDIPDNWNSDGSLKGEAASTPTLGFNYAYTTEEARQRLGEAPYWTFISQKERDRLAGTGAAMPDGGYPITACSGPTSVDTAIRAVGRGAGSHDAIRKHIITRARSLGCSSKIPDNWGADGSLKGEAAATTPRVYVTNGGTTTTGMTVTSATYAIPQRGVAPPPPPAHPAGGGGSTAGSPDQTGADKAVSAHIKAASAAVKAAQQAQAVDPGTETDPNDKKILADLQQIAKFLAQLDKDQDADMTGAAEASEDLPPPERPGADVDQPAMAALADGLKPGNPRGIPGDADDEGPTPHGDIDNDEKCNNPDCGHLGSAHENTGAGRNRGPCQMGPSGHCPGMVPSGGIGVAQAVGVPEGAIGPGLIPSQSIGPAPTPAAAASMTELPPLDPMPNTPVGAAFTVPVAWLEGVDTGDGRRIAPGALTWRTPPLPLMGLETTAHDPSGFSPNDPAVLVGRIENIQIDNGVGTMSGHLLGTPDGAHFSEIIEGMGRMGVSIDVGAAEVQITPVGPDGTPIIEPSEPGEVDQFDLPLMEVLTAGEIMGATVCPFPAFSGAFIVMGDGSTQPGEPLPQPTPEQASMGLRYVDAQPCEPCAAETAPALVASASPAAGAGPLAPPKAWFDDPRFGLDADGNEIDPRRDPRLRETIDAKTGRPSGKFACPITVTPDGRYYGHIAQWGVCHQSPAFLNHGRCILAPRSRTNYAWFHGRGSVLTAEGETLDVGRITADTGHASTSGNISAAAAISHYDHSGLTAAVARCGEDRFGIWAAGSVHPAASAEQVYTLRACPPSGDWRPVGAGQELVAVLTVGEPGFPVARASMNPTDGRLTSLVAAGVPLFEKKSRTPDERLDVLDRGLRPIYRMAASDARRRMKELRDARVG